MTSVVSSCAGQLPRNLPSPHYEVNRRTRRSCSVRNVGAADAHREATTMPIQLEQQIAYLRLGKAT